MWYSESGEEPSAKSPAGAFCNIVGGVLSPLLANIYLHYVLDLWVQAWRKANAKGDVVIVRYADDFVLGFQYRREAERFLAELKDRLRKFGLELHSEKTRLIEFGRFAAANRQERGVGKPETFTFLGLRHICGKTRRGRYLLQRHTDGKRMRAKLREVKTEIRRRMHHPIAKQGRWLGRVVAGYFHYHAVPTNIHAVSSFRTQVARHWFHSLRRRSQRHRLNWGRMTRLVERYLPRARIEHPWPEERFDARTQGKSRMR